MHAAGRFLSEKGGSGRAPLHMSWENGCISGAEENDDHHKMALLQTYEQPDLGLPGYATQRDCLTSGRVSRHPETGPMWLANRPGLAKRPPLVIL